ncbi:hypothetical protein GCM10027571_21190 [Polaromonas eurypsychrophila]
MAVTTAPVLERRQRSRKREWEQATDGRGEKIRASGLYVPTVALHQAELPLTAIPIRRHERRCSSWEANSSKASL